jgi:hypothetical protein
MNNGKLHTKISPLGYTKKKSSDITIKEQLKHVMRDEGKIQKLHDGIDNSRTERNIVLHGDYKKLLETLEGYKIMTAYDRDIMNGRISKLRCTIDKYQKELETLSKDDTKRILKLQNQIESNQENYDKLIGIRDKLVPNNHMIEYYEIKMSISNANHIINETPEKQKEYGMVFQNHMNKFLDENMLFGNCVFSIAHYDQSNAHVHIINKIQGGWSPLMQYYKDVSVFDTKNPFLNMIYDVTKDFHSKNDRLLKDKFQITLDENVGYYDAMNFTQISTYKARTKKKQKALDEVNSFIKLPKSLEVIPNDEKDRYLRLALDAVSQRDEWIYKNIESITWIDDKKHQIDVYKEQLRNLFYMLDDGELKTISNELEQDLWIQKKIKRKTDKEKERSIFLLQMTETFNKFLDYLKENFSKLIYVHDLDKRKTEFEKLDKQFSEFMKQNKENMNLNLAKDIHVKDFTMPYIIDDKKKVKTIDIDKDIKR